MIKAILNGSKTQTRRVCKGKWDWLDPKIIPDHEEGYDGLSVPAVYQKEGMFFWYESEYPEEGGFEFKCPYGIPGDRLWVRETWQQFFANEIPPGRFAITGRAGFTCGEKMLVTYRADGEIPDHHKYGKALWKPSIYMPRWASRITLEITNVRVERLQEISASDIAKEGLDIFPIPINFQKFSQLWDSINGKKYPWSSNPWVFVIEFRKVKP
jgi:hypothetical protein